MALVFWRQWDSQWLHDSAVYLQTLSNLLIVFSLLLALGSELLRRLLLSRSERPENVWTSQAIFIWRLPCILQ